LRCSSIWASRPVSTVYRCVLTTAMAVSSRVRHDAPRRALPGSCRGRTRTTADPVTLVAPRVNDRDDRRVDLRDIEIFLTLAEELHFGRTAERLHVSTPRVSQSIAQQERRIGAPLFERTSRRVTLTPLGARLRDDLE